MKPIIVTLIAFFIFSCKKEKDNSLVGKWILKEVIVSGGGISTTTVPPNHEATVHFKNNGAVVVERNLPGSNFLEHLAQLSNYISGENGVIKFYNPNSTDTLNAHFTLDNQLLLEYETRCYFAEKFIRTY